MQILFLAWNSYGNEDIVYWFKKLNHKVSIFTFPSEEDMRFNPSLTSRLLTALCEKSYDIIFSFNYFPVVSDVAEAKMVKYVSWLYDNPYRLICSKTLGNSCNYVFIFDLSLYQYFNQLGYTTVYYLPLACNTERLDSMKPFDYRRKKYSCDISFVGNLYNDPKNDYFSRLKGITPYTEGYLRGLMDCQKKIYGCYFLEDALPAHVLEDMQKYFPIIPDATGLDSAAWNYASFFLARKITSMERIEILNNLASRHALTIYTSSQTHMLQNVEVKKPVDYYTQMPYIFKCSKINLNITLRSIRSGIPLRAMDIMGCGGFLLTNYQSELLDFFIPNEDFVYYESPEDLMAKAEYYLSHEEERIQIAQNGYEKIKKFHRFDQRIQSIMEIINS